jgi:hypothetical protein
MAKSEYGNPGAEERFSGRFFKLKLEFYVAMSHGENYNIQSNEFY